MIYGSVCSGIEAASVAWHPLGWRGAFLSEIEPFPRAVLAHHWGSIPLHGDFTTIQAGRYADIDLLVGGTPCQSFSVAGLRGGLADDRGNLALEFLRLAHRLRPRWVVWENVPGVLSSNDGRDFGSILGGLAELGYGWAYRVLDAQYFGVPQRRRRVFVVGCLGDWRRAVAVLFERHSMSGHPPPRRQAGQGATRGIEVGPSGGRFTDLACTLDARAKDGAIRNQIGMLAADSIVPTYAPCVSAALRSRDYKGTPQDVEEPAFIAHALRVDGFDASEDGGRGTPIVPVPLLEIGKGSSSRGDGPNGCGIGEAGDPMYTLQAGAQHGVAIPFDTTQITSAANYSNPPAVAFATQQTPKGWDIELGTCPTLQVPSKSGGGQPHAVQQGMAVRRLTPRECERLQGFPDDYTAVPYRGKPAADGPRYKALGNSFAVPVVRWIGQRIQMVEEIGTLREVA